MAGFARQAGFAAEAMALMAASIASATASIGTPFVPIMTVTGMGAWKQGRGRGRDRRTIPVKKRHATTLFTPNGGREVSRRLRQQRVIELKREFRDHTGKESKKQALFHARFWMNAGKAGA